MIPPAISAHFVLTKNADILDQTIFKDMLGYIIWIKTKMMLSSAMFYHNAQKDPAVAADVEKGPHDLLYVTWNR
ncbi:hypothetical protein IFR05_016703 [Cadophora sp. M221]|nr:hypothetical protein IFR05_016703 [Cadophora sp. M221]